MHPDTVEVIVHRLRALVDEKPQQAMDELESLVKQLSVRELTEILCAVYVEISGEMGIDWHFTALQWKLGNRARQQVLPTSRDARFPVGPLHFWQRVVPVPKRDTPPACRFPSNRTGYLAMRRRHALPQPNQTLFQRAFVRSKTRREWWALQDLNL